MKKNRIVYRQPTFDDIDKLCELEKELWGLGGGIDGFYFGSSHMWPSFHGRDFMIFRINPNITKILESDDKGIIIQKIGNHNNMRQYLDSFFGWLNESIRVYGERFYRPV